MVSRTVICDTIGKLTMTSRRIPLTMKLLRRLVSNRMPDGEISSTRKRIKSLALAGFEALQ